VRCDVVLLGQLHLDLCRQCRGIWFDRDELRLFGDAVSDSDLNAQVGEILRDLGTRVSGGQHATYSACPLCAVMMTRTNYAGVSGLILHTCANHGTWADHDEALGLIRLFADGGEAQLREIAARREKDDLGRTLRNLQAAQASNAARIATLDSRSRLHLLLDWFDFL
jgi:Zn-finger nucleic acid-binding protein